ncbi:MAG: HigA family addiction module antitoxin [Myxococcales bacterium]|nr:HigA family addiction module antitoxin [Myxococcales bacterium]
MNARVPAEVFPPGEFVRDELEARGWSQVDLAQILGRSPRLVSEIISGKRQVTPQTASGLAAAFGTDPQFWLNLESAYQLSKVEVGDNTVARRARLYSKLPMKELLRRNWIEPTENIDVLEKRVQDFLEADSLDGDGAFAHAAKGTATESMPPAQLAWLCRVRQIARRLVVPKYKASALRAALPKLRQLLGSPEDVSKVPRVLQECGVRFVVVESLPGSKIDGACFWLSASQPVVGMSLRFDRIDNFWFVLRHEIEHVLLGHGAEQPMVDSDLGAESGGTVGEEATEEERLANTAAADFCVPAKKMDSWVARKDPYFSEKDLLGFARVQSVHPGLVAGQLRQRTKRYNLFSKYLAKIREYLVATAVVDGWGEQHPAT